jgi:hypothetical protein
MHRSGRWFWPCAVLLASCGDSGGGGPMPDDVWHQAKALQGTYVIVQADPVADSCILINLNNYETDDNQTDHWPGVAVQGLPHTVFWIGRTDAAGCSVEKFADFVSAPVQGTVAFKDFVNVNGAPHACAVDVTLDVDGEFVRASNLPIWSEHCERPSGRQVATGSAQAAVRPYSNTVKITSWQPQEQFCMWVSLFLLDEESPMSAAELPPYWAANYGHVLGVSEEECTPEDIHLDPYHEKAAGTLEGVVSFPSTAANEFGDHLPCSVSVDLSLLTEETYPWVPNIVTLRATGIPVAGACE